MGQAAMVSAWAERVEEVAAGARTAVPEHWTGRAALRYQSAAAGIAAGLGLHAARLRGLAQLVHQHEREAAAIRTALAGGGSVAV